MFCQYVCVPLELNSQPFALLTQCSTTDLIKTNRRAIKCECYVGVCDIYRLRLYRNCCFNDVQFDNIEYFAKTLTECTHALAYVVMKGINGARVQLERVLSLHDSVD